MPSFVVRQPNGLLAVFSTVVDAFTLFNANREDVTLHLGPSYTAQEAANKIERGEKECILLDKMPDCEFKRWEYCHQAIKDVHGKDSQELKEMAIGEVKQVQKLTPEQAAIIGAYTGILIGPFSDMHEYIEKVMGRPVFTHEMADEAIMKEIRSKSKSDFVSLCPTEGK